MGSVDPPNANHARGCMNKPQKETKKYEDTKNYLQTTSCNYFLADCSEWPCI